MKAWTLGGRIVVTVRLRTVKKPEENCEKL